jgi:IS5 family transposase
LGAPERPEPGRSRPPGLQAHLLVEASGIPLAVSVTGGQRNDVTQLVPLIDAIRPIQGRVGRPRKRPERLLGDRAYDHDKYRRLVRRRGIRPVIARLRTAHGSGLGRERWVERAFAHLHWFRSLRIRWDRRPEMHIAFLLLACALLCWRRLRSL